MIRPTRWRLPGPRPEADVLREVARVLAGGGVVAYPTDTLYGLAVHPLHRAAVRRLYDLKGRDASQPIPLIAADAEQVSALVGQLPPVARRLADTFWPGPLTLVVAAPPRLPRELLGGGVSVGIRVPSHPLARALARALGVPLTATSANRSGAVPTSEPDEVVRTLGDSLDGVLDAGPSPGGPPSTVVDARSEPPRLVRAGAVPWERVVQFLAS